MAPSTATPGTPSEGGTAAGNMEINEDALQQAFLDNLEHLKEDVLSEDLSRRHAGITALRHLLCSGMSGACL